MGFPGEAAAASECSFSVMSLGEKDSPVLCRLLSTPPVLQEIPRQTGSDTSAVVITLLIHLNRQGTAVAQ